MGNLNRALVAAVLIGAWGALGCGKGGAGAGSDIGIANFKAKKVAKDEPSLGARQSIGDFSFQPPKGAFERKDQSDTNVWQSSGELRWNVAVKQVTARAPSMSELKTAMVKMATAGGAPVGEPSEVDLKGLKAMRFEFDQTIAGEDIFHISYGIPVKEDGTTGQLFQVTFTGRQKEKATLKPIYEAAADSIVVPHAS